MVEIQSIARSNVMDQLFSDARHRKLQKGQILIYEGDPINNLFLIADGYVKVYNIQSDGSTRIIFIYGPDDMFPMTSFLSGAGIGRYFYECMTDVQLKIMPQEKFQQALRDRIEIGEALIGYAIDINNQFLGRIEVLSVSSARRKVVALLQYLIERASFSKGNEHSYLKVPLTAQDIADMCGLTRETVSAQMLKLKKDGVISGSKTLTIDNQKLSRL